MNNSSQTLRGKTDAHFSFRLLAGISLMLNLVLLGFCVVLKSREAVNPAPPETQMPAPAASMTATAGNDLPGSRAISHAPSDLAHWIEALRASGAPPHILVAAAQADFEACWQQRNDEMQRAYLHGEIDADAFAVFNAERDNEAERALRAALGEEAFRAWDQARQFSSLDLKNTALSSDETNSLYQLQKGLQSQIRSLEVARRKKEMDQAEFDRQRDAAQAGYQNQLKTLLGYERYANFTGTGLNADERHALKSMNLTGNQMAAVEMVQCEWEENRAAVQKNLEKGEVDPATANAQIKALDEWREQGFQSTLGTETFKSYQKQQDSRYLDMKNYACQWNLTDQDIDRVYAVLDGYEAMKRECQQQLAGPQPAGDAGSQEQVNDYLQQASNQAVQDLWQYLGPDRYDVLIRNRVLPF
jgi:hypothetical protein